MDAIRNGQRGKVHLANNQCHTSLCGTLAHIHVGIVVGKCVVISLGRSMRHVIKLATCKSCVRLGKEWAQ